MNGQDQPTQQSDSKENLAEEASNTQESGGPDAEPTPPVDESTTNVPKAKGLPTLDEAKQELEATPARSTVLSDAGHVVRDS